MQNGARLLLLLFLLVLPTGTAAQNTAADLKNKGVGPVKDVKLGPVEHELAEKGEDLFESKCTACHKLEQRYVGPALAGVTQRRSPEWIMNMILNPGEMVQNDPIARDLLSQYNIPMTFQNVTRDEARAVLEYFRSEDQKAPAADKAGEKSEPKKRKKLPGT